MEMIIQHIITFEDIYTGEKRQKPEYYIQGFDKGELLYLLALGIQDPKFEEVSNFISWEDQIRLLAQILGKKEINLGKFLLPRLMAFKDRLNTNEVPALFNRIQYLYAINLVLRNKQSKNIESRNTENLIKFMLSINSIILAKQESGTQSFSNFYFKFIKQNEFLAPRYSMLEYFRSIALSHFLYFESEYKEEVIKFFNIRAERPHVYLSILTSIIVTINSEVQIPAVFSSRNDLERNVFKSLSKIFTNKEKEFEFLSLRNSPVFELRPDEWLVLDKKIMIDFLFNHTILQFWFEYIRPNEISDVSHYFGVIGQFYHQYIGNLIQSIFSHDVNLDVKTLDELVFHSKSTTTELGDVLIQKKDKMILGEIKSTFFKSELKYDDESLLKEPKNLKEFKKNFGIEQMAKKIIKLSKNPEAYDFSANEISIIYPILIFHEKAFQCPFSNTKFQTLFLEEIKTQYPNFIVPFPEHSSSRIGNIEIQPLILIHTTDIEILYTLIKDYGIDIFSFLDNYISDGSLIAPFYQYIHKSLTGDFIENLSDIAKIKLSELETELEHKST